MPTICREFGLGQVPISRITASVPPKARSVVNKPKNKEILTKRQIEVARLLVLGYTR
jgi:DNA-binding NarL/FixJ family response regulator